MVFCGTYGFGDELYHIDLHFIMCSDLVLLGVSSLPSLTLAASYRLQKP